MISQLLASLLQYLVNGVRDGIGTRETRKQAIPLEAPPPDSVSLGRIVRSPFEALSQPDAGPSTLLLSEAMMLRHICMLGGTGVGKTTLLLQILKWQVARRNAAVCLLDARGDLVDRVLIGLAHDYTPDELRERLILIDLRDDTYSVPWNLLREPGLDAYTRVAMILDVIAAQWDIGVQTLNTLRACLLSLALTDTEQSLLEVEPLLVDPAFRRRLLSSVSDMTLLRFWDRFEALPDAQQSQWVEPVLNRLSAWWSRPVIRNMCSQQTSLSLRQLLDARPDRILLIALAYDTLYADAELAGNLLITSLLSAVMRTDRPEIARVPTYLAIDEFENFGGSGRQFQQVISEGRRFKIGMCLSHQSSVQVEPKLRSLIKNVIGTQIFYSVGGSEAELLSGEIGSDEPKAALRHLLMNQQVGECLVVQRGQPYVRLRTSHSPDPVVAPEKIAAVRLGALQNFGRPRAAIEAELIERETQRQRPSTSAPIATPPSSLAQQPNASVSSTAPSVPPTLPATVEVRERNEDTPSKIRSAKPSRSRKSKPPPS